MNGLHLCQFPSCDALYLCKCGKIYVGYMVFICIFFLELNVSTIILEVKKLRHLCNKLEDIPKPSNGMTLNISL